MLNFSLDFLVIKKSWFSAFSRVKSLSRGRVGGFGFSFTSSAPRRDPRVEICRHLGASAEYVELVSLLTTFLRKSNLNYLFILFEKCISLNVKKRNSRFPWILS